MTALGEIMFSVFILMVVPTLFLILGLHNFMSDDE